MWHIYFIMWVSWAWKGTLIKNLKNTELDLHIPLSYKTRAIRENEVNWVDAYFISKEDFYAWVQAEKFLEYAIVHETDYYGTKYEDVIDNGVKKWKIVIKELDINWLKKLRQERADLDSLYTTIFLNIPIDILKQRIEKRWALMRDEELDRRLNSAINEERQAWELCNYVIDASQSEENVLKDFLKIIS